MARKKTSIDNMTAPRERWQHGQQQDDFYDEQTHARVQRVDDAVSVLMRLNILETRHRAAADRWLGDYEFGVHGARDPDKRGSGGAGYDALTIARLESCNRYLDAKAAVGRSGDTLLVTVLHERRSIAAVAAAAGCHQKRSTGTICAVLERLVEHYHDVDSKRRGSARHTIAGSAEHARPMAA